MGGQIPPEGSPRLRTIFWPSFQEKGVPSPDELESSTFSILVWVVPARSDTYFHWVSLGMECHIWCGLSF